MATEENKENKDKLLFTREKIKQSLSKALKEVRTVSIERDLKTANMLSVNVKNNRQGAIAVKTDMVEEVEGEYVIDSAKTIDKITEVLVKNAEAYKEPVPVIVVPESGEKVENDKKEQTVVKTEPVNDVKKKIRNIILSAGFVALGFRNGTYIWQ